MFLEGKIEFDLGELGLLGRELELLGVELVL